MADQLANYQCPNCGGPLTFDPALQKLHCEYCDSAFTQQEVEDFFKKREDAAAQAGLNAKPEYDDWSNDESAHLRAYNCPSCGAQVYADENTAVTRCPYCNNPTVVAAQFAAKRPRYVMPFQLKKEQAVEALHAFYKGKHFLPKAFKNENHIQEVKGVYVPFWLYNGTIDADMTFHCTNTRQYRQGDNMVTETMHYTSVRKGDVDFENIPADASSKMPNEYMDALEPFDYSKLVDFSSAYMAGFLADSYDETSEQNQSRADERMKNSTLNMMLSTVTGYSAVVPERQSMVRTAGTATYAFLPVWLLSTQYKDKNYLFAVNGQSGRVVGDLPADKSAIAKTFFILFAVLLLICAIGLYMDLGGSL